MSTVDPERVKYYSAKKDIWWDEDGPMFGLHAYNPIRVQFIKDELINTGFKMQNLNLSLKRVKILEVGCGGGIMAESLARLGAQVTGIDISAELIDIAKKHVKLSPDMSERVNYIHTTIENFVQKNREIYDAVVICEVLVHVADPQLFLKVQYCK